MRIGVFVLMAGREAGGPETYEVEMLRALAGIDSRNEYIIYCTGTEAPRAIGVQQPNFSYRVLYPSARSLSVPVTLPIQAVRDGIDVLHSTFTPPPLAPLPKVLTLHCLSSFVHPEYYASWVKWRLNGLLRIGMRHAASVLCVSQATADDVHERFRVPRERLSVTYNGVDDRFRPVPSAVAARTVRDELGVSGPFALFLGKLEPRKNVIRLIEAFARFRRETGTETSLVLAGHQTAVTPAIDEAIERLGLADAVKRPGYVSPRTLPALYSAARMFLLPSLWEGFGIPIVEAMACGTPVVTSNVTSLPEVAGDAAVLVNPYSVDSIAEGMALVDSDSELRRSLIGKGLERARAFTWQNCASETLRVYDRIASS